jgi:hypothetical protein
MSLPGRDVAGHNVTYDADRVGAPVQRWGGAARVRRHRRVPLVHGGRGLHADVELGQSLPVPAEDQRRALPVGHVGRGTATDARSHPRQLGVDG